MGEDEREELDLFIDKNIILVQLLSLNFLLNKDLGKNFLICEFCSLSTFLIMFINHLVN